MESLEKHFTECENRKTYHTCKICDEQLNKEEERDGHKSICPEARYQCPHCNKEFKNKDIKEHMDACIMRLVTCGNCHCLVPLKDETSHKDYFCSLLYEINCKIINIKMMIY